MAIIKYLGQTASQHAYIDTHASMGPLSYSFRNGFIIFFPFVPIVGDSFQLNKSPKTAIQI